MSLEAALQKNTEASLQLTAMLAAVIGKGLGPKAFDLEAANAAAAQKTADAVAARPATVVVAANITPATEPAPAPAATGAALDYEKDVKPKALAASRKLTREPFIALLNEFGVVKVSEATPDQWPALVAAFDKALAA
jgi:hypothetical protein